VVAVAAVVHTLEAQQERAEQAVAAMLALEQEIITALRVLLIQVVVEVVVRLTPHQVTAVMAAQASSSSNTKHLFNLYSHSKVLASGLPLLA
jgi:L-cystine uptake protein TcyP (sodium:dicarboxylate symporter family)